MQDLNFILAIAVLIMSVVIHEVSHGYAANALGDPTAKLAGRLTLNPVKHLDPLGSIIIPGILLLTGSPFLIGWARPVPYNPYNLRGGKWGPGWVAFAGPLANISIALIFTLFIRIAPVAPFFTSEGFLSAASLIIYINLILALFNLIPIPPLDGSKVLMSFLPYHYQQYLVNLEHLGGRYGLIFVFIFIMIFAGVFFNLIQSVFFFLTGIPLPI